MKAAVGMRSLYLRIWLTVILTLGVFAVVSGWIVQRHLEDERARNQALIAERIAAWGDLILRSLPPASAPANVQAQALTDWSQRLRVPMALEDAQGHRIAVSQSFLRREAESATRRPPAYKIRLDDGRALWVMRPAMLKPPPPAAAAVPPPGEPVGLPPAGARPDAGGTGLGPGPVAGPEGPADFDHDHDGDPEFDHDHPMHRVRAIDVLGPLPRFPFVPLPRGVPPGVSLMVLVSVLFLAIAAGAWPVVRRLTRRLESLQRGVEAFGAGALDRRVPEEGRDEVAAVARSFNRAAERIEALVRSNRSLLANASHELRSPLARLKMATSMLGHATPGEDVEHLRREIDTDIAELDALVDEVLLASRLEASPAPEHVEPVDLLALAVEEGARVGAAVDGLDTVVPGEERLLRRALRNLLENARRYGGGEVRVDVRRAAGRDDRVEIEVRDNGPGVPEAYRARVFEPFFRLPGHAEREGGVGLGLALVRQIAERHHGGVRIETPPGGGGCFVITLPGAAPAAA